MPVMLWGALYSGKRYKPGDYVHAGVITLGCTVFVVTGAVTSRASGGGTGREGGDNEEEAAWYTVIGAALMVVYLAVDGLTSTWQDSLFQRYSMGICDQVHAMAELYLLY